jgi:hypothetical protein
MIPFVCCCCRRVVLVQEARRCIYGHELEGYKQVHSSCGTVAPPHSLRFLVVNGRRSRHTDRIQMLQRASTRCRHMRLSMSAVIGSNLEY